MTTAEQPRRPGRPPQLSRQQILDAVAASENVDQLTMRELAARLGVRHGALYRWVANRDELFDLIGEAAVERILSRAEPLTGAWRPRLRRIVQAMHDEFLGFPGYATHLSRPHPHSDHSTQRLRDAVVAVFADAGADEWGAQQSWYVVVTGVVGWLAFQEQAHHLSQAPAQFDVLVDVLLRGLPARRPQGEASQRSAKADVVARRSDRRPTT